MSNFAICFNNYVDSAILSAGSWNASFPLANLQDYRLAKKARSTNALTGSTVVRFALPSIVRIGSVILAATNASVYCESRLRLFSNAGFTSVIYDSGNVNVYPAGTYPFGTLEWGSASWWTAAPVEAEVARFQNNVVHVLLPTVYAQYGEVQITDTSNPSGYFEAGRLFVGDIWQPAVNCSYGELSQRLTSRSDVSRAIDGTPYFTTRRPDFSIPAGFKHLDQDEAMRALDLQAVVDVTGEAMAIIDTSDIAYAFRRRVFGRIKQLDPLEYPNLASHAMAFQVEGVL